MAASTTRNVSVRFEITGNGVQVTKELDGSVSKLNLTMKQADAVAKKYGTTLQGLTNKTFKTSNAEFQKMSGHMGKMRDATGGATSAAMELGRVVSDAPYGIRGMANNITQLVSQLGFAASATDKVTGKTIGWKGALRETGKALTGTLGIVFAITAVVSIMEYLSMATEKASEEIKELTKSFDELLVKIGLITPELSNIPTEVEKTIRKITDQIDGVESKSLSSNFLLEISDSLKIMNNEFPEFKNGFDKLSDSQKNNAEATANLLVKYKELTNVRSRAAVVLGKIQSLQEKIDKGELKREFTNIDALGKEYRQLLLNKVALEELFKKEKTGRTSRARDFKAFKQQLLDLNKEYRGYIDENEKLTERSARNRLIIEQEADAKELEIKYNLYVAKQTQRHNDYLATVTDLKLREDAQNKHNEAMKLAKDDYGETVNKLRIRNQTQLAEFDRIEEERQIQVQFKQMERELKHYNKLYERREVLFQENQIRLEQKRLEEAERLAEMYDFGTKERFDADVDVVNQRMNLRQSELDHEIMVIEERKRINMEYIGFISQLGSIFQQLAGENEALATAALVIEKGAAIANIVIEAQASIAKKTVSANGIPAFLGVGIPNPSYILAQADAVRANTMTKATAGLSIASILATSIKGGNKSVKGAPSGGGSGAGGREFDFNLVGSTGENQLAQGIAGQFNQPIQAYVVSTQMSSQQQLDARIQSTASLGE